MISPAAIDETGLSLADLKRIDEACDRFEAEGRSGELPELEPYLAEFSGPARARLFRELLGLELEYRRHRGERRGVDAYRSRFPDLVPIVDSVFRRLDPAGAAAADAPASSGAVSEVIANRLTEFGSDLPRAQIGAAPLEALRADGYELLGELGRGGMGVVYLARKVALNRLCALKMILAGAHAGPAASARFRAEAEMVARLRHPGIVQIFHVGEADGLPYLELEFVRGGSLDQTLGGTPRSAAEAAGLIETLARSIAEAHRQGIIHRDLKPANILLDTNGQPKVADFGLAKVLDTDDGLTKSHAVLGSPSYMAPEQAEGGSRLVGPPTDVYALGAILYELVTGRPPFRAATALETMAQVKWNEPVPPSQFQPGLPRDLETICLKCLQKSPSRRYPTADALAEDLRRYLAREPIQARPITPWERAWKWGRRRPTLAAAIGLGATSLALLLGGALYYNSRLRTAVAKAQAAEHVALEQRNLALAALNQLVFGVQERLGNSPATRPIRQQLLDSAIRGLNEIARNAEAAAPDLSRATAHQKLGDIYSQLGRSTDARRQYVLSQRLAQSLAEARPFDPVIKECLEKAAAGLGQLEIRDHRYTEAVKTFQFVVELAEEISAQAPNHPGARRGLIEAYLQLGRAYGFAKDYEPALAWLRRSHGLAQRWVADEPESTKAKELLAWNYRKLADIKKFLHDPDGARTDYARAIAIDRALVAAEPADADLERHLAVALHDLAGVEFHQGRRAEALPHYEEAERLFIRRAAADPDSLEIQAWLFRVEFDLARLHRSESRIPQAIVLYEGLLKRFTDLDRAGRLEHGQSLREHSIPELRERLAECEAELAKRD